MIPLWLFTTLASAGTLDADLEAAAAAADARITACKAEPESCVGDESALARAFLVRATAASVLRGEVDRVSAANARLLDRDALVDWSDLLPAEEHTQPDPWVTALAAAAWAARANDADCCARPAPTGPPALRQVVVDMSGAFDVTLRDRPRATVGARLAFERGLGLRLDGAVSVFPTSGGALGQSYRTAVPTVKAAGAIGVGWWRPLRSEGENLLSVGLVLGGEQAAAGADDSLYAQVGYVAPDEVFSYGVQLADVVRVPLGRAERLHFAGEGLVQVLRRVNLPHRDRGEDDPYVWGLSTGLECDTRCASRTQVTLEAALGLEWRPQRAVRLAFSVRAIADLPFRARPDVLAELRVGWASRRKPETLGDVDRQLQEVELPTRPAVTSLTR